MKDNVKKQYKHTESSELKYIRRYSYFLLLVLFILNVLAFFGFKVVAEYQLKYDLKTFSQAIKSPEEIYENLSYTNGIVVIPRKIAIEDDRYREIKVAGTEYLVYAPPSRNYLYTIPESQIKQDLILTGLILMVLYIAEVVVLFGWWTLLKERVDTVFSLK